MRRADRVRSLLALALALALSCPPRLVAQSGPPPRPAPELPTAELKRLEAFSRASTDWGKGVEATIEDAYRRCFRTYRVGDSFITLRMPFGENGERADLAEEDLAILGGGKARPDLLWKRIDALLASQDFRAYAEALSDGREKLIIFDLEKKSWSQTRDWFYIDRMNRGAYPGLPHRPFVVSRGGGVDESAVYDYVYCVGRLGMDCSGFVFYVLKSVAASVGIDLERKLGYSATAPKTGRSTQNIGSWFFDPRNRALETVKDEVRNLRPGDVILFRAEDGSTLHTAVIQSVELEKGRIRYLQSTDEAPRPERGVHESLILFDPARPELSLKDPSLTWLQTRAPTFEGELLSPYRDDGERYRAVQGGGGTVVRLRLLSKALGYRR
jgi:hypothetical protein